MRYSIKKILNWLQITKNRPKLNRTSLSLKPESTIIFYDQEYPNNWELRARKGKPHMSVKKYYNQINKFFDLIEKTFKKKIIVCGHPKRKLKGLYSRKMVFNRSVELTQNAAFCMAHNSYAVNFPIILRDNQIL